MIDHKGLKRPALRGQCLPLLSRGERRQQQLKRCVRFGRCTFSRLLGATDQLPTAPSLHKLLIRYECTIGHMVIGLAHISLHSLLLDALPCLLLSPMLLRPPPPTPPHPSRQLRPASQASKQPAAPLDCITPNVTLCVQPANPHSLAGMVRLVSTSMRSAVTTLTAFCTPLNSSHPPKNSTFLTTRSFTKARCWRGRYCLTQEQVPHLPCSVTTQQTTKLVKDGTSS